MEKNIAYTIIQFLPDPDRLEAINLGILLFDQRERRVHFRFTDDYSRITRSFSHVNKTFLNLAVGEIQERLKREASKPDALEALRRFQTMRSNNIRLTPFLPTFANRPMEELDRLYEELVGEISRKPRRQRVGQRLKVGLRQLHVLQNFDQNPESVSLPRYKLKITPDLAIRRESMNLIEAARFDEPDMGLTQAGRHALAGRALNQNLNMKLIVVGDFGDQPRDYYEAIKEDLERADTLLFRMDDLVEFAQAFAVH